MANLLSLPREIRDQIFNILLFDPLLEDLPSVADVRKSNTRRDPDEVSAKKIRYPSQQPAINPIDSLSLVNSQLRAEVCDAIAHFQKCGGAGLTLDLLLEDNQFLFPTWLNVLPYAMPIKEMHIQIRPFVELQSTNADPFVAAWRLGALINNFLTNGPQLHGASSTTKSIVVEHMVLYLSSEPSLCSQAQFEQLLNFLVGHLDGFLTVRSKKYHVPWGPMLLSRIRKLSIKVGDIIATEIDTLARAKACGVKIVERLGTGTDAKAKPVPKQKPGKFRAKDNIR